MRRLIAPALAVLLFVPGCGGGGDPMPASGVPASASALETKLRADAARSLWMVGNFESSLVFVLNPGTPMAQGVTLVPDTSLGAAPYSVTFSGPFDGNGDGFNETSLTGRATFNSDPANTWSGLGGQATLDVNIPIVGHIYHADVAFSFVGDERRLSGSGRFTDPLSGNVTTMTVAAATPLVMKAATGSAGALANGCGYSLDGRLRLDVASAAGNLTSTWNFASNSSSVAVNAASFTDSNGLTTPLPDSTLDLRCGSGGSINDWAAVFDQRWACLPRESGQARLTLAVTAADTVTITDEDPPDSGNINTYRATIVAANPHALRGSFTAGPVGNRYREDFNWSLSRNGSVFSQTSTYTYIEGLNQGFTGHCVASARRLP